MARTGSLLTSGTSLWCPVLPLALPFWFTGPFPFHAVSTLPGRHPYLSSASSHSPVTPLDCPPILGGVVRVFSSTLLPGFLGPESSVLHADLSSSAPFPFRVSPYSGPFDGSFRKHSEPEQEDFPG